MKNKATNPARTESNSTKPNHAETNTVTECGFCN